MSCGSTPVDESNVFGCPEGFKRRGPGGHLGASNHKSTKSNEEMNDFREDVPNEAWELEISLGVLNEALARSPSIKSTFWTLKLTSGSTPVDKINVLELQIEPFLNYRITKTLYLQYFWKPGLL